MAIPLAPSSAHGIMSQEHFVDRTLSATTSTTTMFGAPLPATIVLNSSDGARAIQYSVDTGTTYITPTYTVSSTGQLVYVLTFSVTNVKVTGAIGDRFWVL